MEKSSYPSGKRIFRIDDECYIIYLGSGTDDLKPFLRIGNSKSLSEDNITSNIFNIVITESYTGNPAYEPSNLNISDLKENRYVGENSTVDRLLKYLKNCGIDTKDIPHFHEVKTGDHRAMLYMYDDGNLTLSYNNETLFNLHSIEQKDQHFVVKAGWIKDRLSKNTLRYVPDHFKPPGFTIVKHSLMLLAGEELIAFEPPEDYFFSLASHGLDPDMISTAVTNEASAGLFDLCKRKHQVKKNLSVLSTNTSLLKSALELFSAKKPNPLKVKLGALSELTSGTAAGFKIQRKAKQYIITRNNFPGIVTANGHGNDDHIIIDTQKNQCVLPGRKKSGSIKLADGIPILVLKGAPDKEAITNNYFKSLAGIFKHASDNSALSFSELILDFFNTVAGGDDPGKILIKIKREIKKIGSLAGNPLVFLVNNAREASVFYEQTFSENNPQSKVVIKSVRDLGKRMNRLLGAVDKITVHQPLIGDCFVDEKGSYIFFRTIKKVINRDEYLGYDEFKSALMDRKKEESELFDLEKQQLYALISDLKAGAKTAKKSAEKTKKTAGPAGLKTGKEPGARPVLKQTRKKEVKQKKGPEQPEKQEEKEKTPRTPPVSEKKEEKVPVFKRFPLLKIIIPLAVIIILALVLFLPPVSILKKGFDRKATRDELVLKGGEGEKVLEEDIEERQTSGKTGTAAESKDKGPGGRVTETGGEEKVALEAGDFETNPEKIEAFLSLGYIQITILDVYKLSNIIALSNGYKGLDSIEQLGKDPNWIYPGNVFELPDKTVYTVVKGDTIWHIAKRFIQKNVDRDWARYQEIMKEITEDNRDELKAELEALQAISYSENFAREVKKALSGLK